MEGTVPVPPYYSCADSDDDVVPVQVVSHLGGAEVAGEKTLVERSGFFTISPEPDYYLLRV